MQSMPCSCSLMSESLDQRTPKTVCLDYTTYMHEGPEVPDVASCQYGRLV